MELSKKDRLMLINQYRILSILNPDGASSYNIRIKMLEEGYSLHYDEMVNWIDDGMSREACQEIIDILEMYRCLWHSYKKLKDKKGISKKDVRFPGFDAKDEERELNYAEYVMYSLKRYKEFHQKRRLPNHDSYKVMLGQYRSMLSVWNSLGNRRILTRDEIIQILNGERDARAVDDAAFEPVKYPEQYMGISSVQNSSPDAGASADQESADEVNDAYEEDDFDDEEADEDYEDEADEDDDDEDADMKIVRD